MAVVLFAIAYLTAVFYAESFLTLRRRRCQQEDIRMAREQEMLDKIDALGGKLGDIGAYVRGIADDLRNNGTEQTVIDTAIQKLDALAAAADQIKADEAPDPTPPA